MKSIRKYLAEIGAKGGKSKTERKRAAVRANIAKAREARLKQLEEAKKQPAQPSQ